MRSFKNQQQFTPSATQQQIYSPSRTNYQNRVMNATQNSKNNKNRTQQIVLLHQEFQDLKRKIKQVQNKNQKIIQKIHRQCNFKKKTPQTFQATGQRPIIYYEKQQKSQISQASKVSQKSGMSVDQSNKSDQSEYEFRQKKNKQVQRNSVQSNKHMAPKQFSQSMQYTRGQMMNQNYNSRQKNQQMIIKKKYSKITNKNYQQQEQQQPNSQQLIQDEFNNDMKFQLQQHNTYNHFRDFQFNNSGNFNNSTNSGKSSAKKTNAHMGSYPASQTHMAFSQIHMPPAQTHMPASQTHMGYSMFNNNPTNLSSNMPQSQNQFNYQKFDQQNQSQIRTTPLFNQSIINQTQQSRNLSQIQQSPQTTNSQVQIYQLEESLKIQKQKTAYLQKQIQSKQFQIINIKKQYTKLLTQFENIEMILECEIQQFFENTVKKGFFDIDKQLRKYQVRLRNLSINIKDEYEQHKSSKLIKQHQLRRSNSRSRKDMSPIHNTSIHSVINPPTQNAKIPRPASSQGNNLFSSQAQNIQPSQTSLIQGPQVDKRSSRVSQQSKKNKQFEQIVQKYEEMINSKKDQIFKLQTMKISVQKRNQMLQRQLQAKDNEVKQFKQRLQQLDKLMTQMSNQGPIANKIPKRAYRVSSTQSNLLQDIDHDQEEDEQSKFEQLYNEAKNELMEKNNKISQCLETIDQYENKITQYQKKIRQCEIKIKKLQTSNSSESIKISQKSTSTIDKLARQQIEQQIKKHLTQLHKIQITHKDNQISKNKQQRNKIQKKLVEKDCENISLQNKIKKLQNVNQLNVKKIQQYQKLLHHYQHNYSIDLAESTYHLPQNGYQGGNVLDRSLCNDQNNYTSRSTTGIDEGLSPKKILNKQKSIKSASKNQITITKSQFESLQNQLKQMSQQILQLTKKNKQIQKLNQQKSSQIQRLSQQLQNKNVDNNKWILQNNKLNQLNEDLNNKIIDLEEQLYNLKDKQRQQNEGDDQDLINDDEDMRQSRRQYKQNKKQKIHYSGRKHNNEDHNKSMGQSSLPQQQYNSASTNKHRKRLSQIQVQNNMIKQIQLRKKSQQQSLLQHLHNQQTINRLQQQIQSLKLKTIQLSSQYNLIKQQNLQLSRVNISIKKNNQYLQDVLSDRQKKYQKYKKQYQQLKIINNQLLESLNFKQQLLNKQKLQNFHKIQQLQKQWHQFQQEINKNNNPDNLHSSNQSKHNLQNSQILKSSRYNISQSSMLLSSTIHNKNSQYLIQQNQFLTIKLKQAEATIQMHNIMEQKVINEYKNNVDKLKNQIKQKNKEIENIKKELQSINNDKRRLQVLYESTKNYLAQSRMSQNNTNNQHVKFNQTNQLVNNKDNNQLSIRKRLISQESIKKSQRSRNNQQDKDLLMQQFPSYNQDSNNLSMMSNQNQQQVHYTTQSNTYPNNNNLNNQSENNSQSKINNLISQQEEQRLYPYERILQLEGQLKQAKDINLKLQQMEEQLFKQIRLKQEEKKDLIKLIQQKNHKILQLEEIVQLKQNHNNITHSHLGSHILASHISSSNYKSSSQNKHSHHNLSQRQSLHSHSSLRYSGITHLKPNLLGNPSSNNLQVMGQSQFGTSQRFEIQLSETGSQMLDKSYVTNISQIFEKQQFPYEKVQLKRKQQIKLFEKTASYIKSLKQSINDKNKRIKLLQKKIQSLKNTHHGPISKQLQNKYEISTRANQQNEDIQIQFESIFKDYQSVQLQRKKASHNKRFKNLQHEWKLAIQQNNVLSNQVQVLQQELQKAQQQQNSILAMKDLYKQQIKKLLAKNQQQTNYYQDLLAKEKKKVQQSQSVHNLQTIKQLFIKVLDCIIVMESEKSKKKRQQKKKELQQFFKIFASLCAVQQSKKNAILQGIKKMTLNIVLAEDGRAASKGKE